MRSDPGRAAPESDSHVAELRRQVGCRLLMVPAVAVVVRDPAGRLLLVRDRATNRWGLPAGAVELGERPDVAARRELAEETGLSNASLRLVGGVGGSEFRYTYPNGDEVEYHVFIYSTEVVSPPTPTDSGEIAEARFFERSEAPDLELPYPDDLLWA